MEIRVFRAITSFVDGYQCAIYNGKELLTISNGFTSLEQLSKLIAKIAKDMKVVSISSNPPSSPLKYKTAKISKEESKILQRKFEKVFTK
ncbi:MAG: hypothetical protein ABH887_02355 [bacterium]